MGSQRLMRPWTVRSPRPDGSAGVPTDAAACGRAMAGACFAVRPCQSGARSSTAAAASASFIASPLANVQVPAIALHRMMRLPATTARAMAVLPAMRAIAEQTVTWAMAARSRLLGRVQRVWHALRRSLSVRLP